MTQFNRFAKPLVFILLLSTLFLTLSSSVVAQGDCFASTGNISAPPPGFDAFYKKFLLVNGIPIISSEKVPDEAICQAKIMVEVMTSALSQQELSNMISNGAALAILAEEEVITDIPEYSNLYQAYPTIPWNSFRGIGGTLSLPLSSCAEEDLLCYSSDTIYVDESIAVHEFAHGIHNLALAPTHPQFNAQLYGIYEDAMANNRWNETYAAYNYTEYFAEGVQCWFNTNAEAIPPNGVHNHVNTRQELLQYDPQLYNLIAQFFTAELWSPECELAATATSNPNLLNDFTLTPNPAGQTIYIQIEESGSYIIKIFTIEGQLVLVDEHRLIESTPYLLDVDSLNRGIYLVQLQKGDRLSVKTLLIQK